MKNSKILHSVFVFSLLILFSFAGKDEPISVTVKIEMMPDTKFEHGTLTIKETGQTFEITEAKDFTIPLKKGKYTFRFTSETPHLLSYPGKITDKENVVKIALGTYKLHMQEYATAENWQLLLKEEKLKFVHFGIAPANEKEFFEKYRIGVKCEGCVITPTLSTAAKTNNEIVADYLSSKFGENWKKELKFTPFGLE